EGDGVRQDRDLRPRRGARDLVEGFRLDLRRPGVRAVVGLPEQAKTRQPPDDGQATLGMPPLTSRQRTAGYSSSSSSTNPTSHGIEGAAYQPSAPVMSTSGRPYPSSKSRSARYMLLPMDRQTPHSLGPSIQTTRQAREYPPSTASSGDRISQVSGGSG